MTSFHLAWLLSLDKSLGVGLLCGTQIKLTPSFFSLAATSLCCKLPTGSCLEFMWQQKCLLSVIKCKTGSVFWAQKRGYLHPLKSHDLQHNIPRMFLLPVLAPVEEAQCWIVGFSVQQSKAFCRKNICTSKVIRTRTHKASHWTGFRAFSGF